MAYIKFLIWRYLRDLPNRQIKATAKYTTYTVYTTCVIIIILIV